MDTIEVCVDEKEIIQIVLQYLKHRNHYEALRWLEKDTQIQVDGDIGDELLFIRKLTLEGKWKDLETTLQLLKEEKCEFDLGLAKFYVRRQRFLELLDQEHPVATSRSLQVALNSISQLECCSPEQLNQLKFCLANMDPTSNFPNWSCDRGRYRCFLYLVEVAGLGEVFLNDPKCLRINKDSRPKLFEIFQLAAEYNAKKLSSKENNNTDFCKCSTPCHMTRCNHYAPPPTHYPINTPCAWQPNSNVPVAVSINRYLTPRTPNDRGIDKMKQGLDLSPTATSSHRKGIAFDILNEEVKLNETFPLSSNNNFRKFGTVATAAKKWKNKLSNSNKSEENHMNVDSKDFETSMHGLNSPDDRNSIRRGESSKTNMFSENDFASSNRRDTLIRKDSLKFNEDLFADEAMPSQNRLSPHNTENYIYQKQMKSKFRNELSTDSYDEEAPPNSNKGSNPEMYSQHCEMDQQRNTSVASPNNSSQKKPSFKNVSKGIMLGRNYKGDSTDDKDFENQEFGDEAIPVEADMPSPFKNAAKGIMLARKFKGDSTDEQKYQLENQEFGDEAIPVDLDMQQEEIDQLGDNTKNDVRLRSAILAARMGRRWNNKFHDKLQNESKENESGDDHILSKRNNLNTLTEVAKIGKRWKAKSNQEIEESDFTMGDELVPEDSKSFDQYEMGFEDIALAKRLAKQWKMGPNTDVKKTLPNKGQYKDEANASHSKSGFQINENSAKKERQHFGDTFSETLRPETYNDLANEDLKGWLTNFHPCASLLEGGSPIRTLDFSDTGKEIAIGSNSRSIHLARIQGINFCQSSSVFTNTAPALKPLRLMSPTNVSKATRNLQFGYSSGIPARLPLLPIAHEETSSHLGSVYCLAWCPGEIETPLQDKFKLLASGSNDKYVKIWQVHNGNEDANTSLTLMHKLQGHQSTIRDVMFLNRDSNQQSQVILATAAGGLNGIMVWDVLGSKVKKPIQTMKGHNGTIFQLSKSTNSNKLFSCSEDSTIQVWDCRTNSKSICMQSETAAHSISCSPTNENTIASGHICGTCSVWDIRMGSQILELNQHTDDVRSVDFSPDGRWILTGSFDGTVGIIDTEAFQQDFLASFRGHDSKILKAKWHPKHPYFLTCSADNTAKIWTMAGKSEDMVTLNQLELLS